MRSFLGTVLQSNFGEKDWVRVFESMNLIKKKNEVQKWVDKGQICPSGWQGPRTFFGMTEIRDADASKKTKLVTLRGAWNKIFAKNLDRLSFQMRHVMNWCIMQWIAGTNQKKKLEMFLSQNSTTNIYVILNAIIWIYIVS